MELRVYDRDLQFKGIVDNFLALTWTRRFYEPGEFLLKAPISSYNLSLLAPGSIIAKRDGVEAGVVEDLTLNESPAESTMTVSGRFLSAYMDRRLIKATFVFNGRVEVAMRSLLTNCVAIPLVELGTLQGFTDSVQFQATMKNLLTMEEKLSRFSDIGFRFRPDFSAKKIYFETYKGVDRRNSQNSNSRVVFSESYNNLLQASYHYNDQLARTLVIVGGEGEGSDRKYVSVGGGTGLDLREIFVDAKNMSSNDMTDAEYENALRQRALDELASSVVSESLDCEADPAINFRYRSDYDLGDIITLQKESWGIGINQRITEIQEVYENDGCVIIPTFGDPLPEKVDWGD